MMTILTQTSWTAALDELDFYWGAAYELARIRGEWVARRLDDSRDLLAASPEELRQLIAADYKAQPVPCGMRTVEERAAMDPAQAQALKDLDIHWGEPYAITVGSHGWMARRRDNGHSLVAATPEDLEELIEADSGAKPVRLGAHADEGS